MEIMEFQETDAGSGQETGNLFEVALHHAHCA